MSTRTASWLAWSLWGLSLTLTALALLLLALNLSHPHTHTFDDCQVGVILGAFSSGSVESLRPIRNPLGIEGFSNNYDSILVNMVATFLLVAAASSVFMRLRGAIGAERQQIKWFAYAAAATVIGLFLAYVIPDVIGTPLWFERAGYAVLIAVIPAIPISIGIAILRYRLYDIDIIINRTLVYGSLTTILFGVYFGGVTAIQALFRTISGQEQLPQLVIVASTLVIAGLFNPLRRSIQSLIDRSFYRSKYDARKTLEVFSKKLRDETDLEALNDDLVGVVRETIQPAHVSLWLPPEIRKGE